MKYAERERREGALLCTMEKGNTVIFCGVGRGKTIAALGKAILSASYGKNVMVIQFLKNKSQSNMEFLHRLEPEIKMFRFERSEKSYEDMDEKERQEEQMNIRNGLNFARKVLTTQSCDVLILDEVLGLLETGIVSEEDLRSLIGQKSEETDLILTGLYQAPELWDLADEVTVMSREK